MFTIRTDKGERIEGCEYYGQYLRANDGSGRLFILEWRNLEEGKRLTWSECHPNSIPDGRLESATA